MLLPAVKPLLATEAGCARRLAEQLHVHGQGRPHRDDDPAAGRNYTTEGHTRRVITQHGRRGVDVDGFAIVDAGAVLCLNSQGIDSASRDDDGVGRGQRVVVGDAHDAADDDGIAALDQVDRGGEAFAGSDQVGVGVTRCVRRGNDGGCNEAQIVAGLYEVFHESLLWPGGPRAAQDRIERFVLRDCCDFYSEAATLASSFDIHGSEANASSRRFWVASSVTSALDSWVP